MNISIGMFNLDKSAFYIDKGLLGLYASTTIHLKFVKTDFAPNHSISLNNVVVVLKFGKVSSLTQQGCFEFNFQFFPPRLNYQCNFLTFFSFFIILSDKLLVDFPYF